MFVVRVVGVSGPRRPSGLYYGRRYFRDTRPGLNLFRNELTALERGEQLSRRKEIYEAIHPDAKGSEQQKKGLNVSRETISRLGESPASFARDTALKTGVSKRTVEQEVQIAIRCRARRQKTHLRLLITSRQTRRLR